MPAVLPPMHYLQLPAPPSTSSGSQQLRLCDQGMCKPDIAVKKVELLANVGTWLKESTCATVSSSEQVRAASARRTLHRYAFPRPTACTLASALAHLCTHLLFAIPDPPPSQRSGEPQRQRDRCASADAPTLRNPPRQSCEGQWAVCPHPPSSNSAHTPSKPRRVIAELLLHRLESSP